MACSRKLWIIFWAQILKYFNQTIVWQLRPWGDFEDEALSMAGQKEKRLSPQWQPEGTILFVDSLPPDFLYLKEMGEKILSCYLLGEGSGFLQQNLIVTATAS